MNDVGFLSQTVPISHEDLEIQNIALDVPISVHAFTTNPSNFVVYPKWLYLGTPINNNRIILGILCMQLHSYSSID